MAEWPRGPARKESLESRWQQVVRTSSCESSLFFFAIPSLNFHLCLLRLVFLPKKKKKKEKKMKGKPCQTQKVAVRVSYSYDQLQLIEKFVEKVQSHFTSSKSMACVVSTVSFHKHSSSSDFQIFLSRKSPRDQKRKEVLQILSGRCGCVRIHIRSVSMCVAEPKVNE